MRHGAVSIPDMQRGSNQFREWKKDMLTATARKHIVRALRSALRIRESQAVAIMETHRNDWQLEGISGDVRGIKALVYDKGDHGVAGLYLDSGRGFEGTGVDLRVEADDMKRWRSLPQDEAFAIAVEIAANMYQPTYGVQVEDELLPEEEMDIMFGQAPEPRDFKWMDGTINRVSMASTGDHVVALVDLEDGTRKTMGMIPLFSDAAGLLAYASERVGTSSRLSVGRINAFDQNAPAGYDRSMPLLDMIVPHGEVRGLVRSMRPLAA